MCTATPSTPAPLVTTPAYLTVTTAAIALSAGAATMDEIVQALKALTPLATATPPVHTSTAGAPAPIVDTVAATATATPAPAPATAPIVDAAASMAVPTVHAPAATAASTVDTVAGTPAPIVGAVAPATASTAPTMGAVAPMAVPKAASTAVPTVDTAASMAVPKAVPSVDAAAAMSSGATQAKIGNPVISKETVKDDGKAVAAPKAGHAKSAKPLISKETPKSAEQVGENPNEASKAPKTTCTDDGTAPVPSDASLMEARQLESDAAEDTSSEVTPAPVAESESYVPRVAPMYTGRQDLYNLLRDLREEFPTVFYRDAGRACIDRLVKETEVHYPPRDLDEEVRLYTALFNYGELLRQRLYEGDVPPTVTADVQREALGGAANA